MKRPQSEPAFSRDEIALMVAVAELYHIHHKTQQEIARTLGTSRSKVSRLLTKAEKAGIVEVTVRNPYSNVDSLSQDLARVFQLEKAIVVPMTPDNDQLITPALGRAAAQFILSRMPRSTIVGVGRGASVNQTVEHLGRNVRLSPIVVPLTGGMGQQDMVFPAFENARRFAEYLGGSCAFIYAPALVRNKRLKESILSEEPSREAVELWDRLDWVLTGIGTVPLYRGLPDATFRKALDNFVKEVNEMPVADVCSWFILRDGRIPVTSRACCLISASPEQVRRASVRLALAGGLRKVEAILAALRTGLITVLVTEERTAEAVLALNEKADKGQSAVEIGNSPASA
ncbi:MAG: MarR family transcriptional regulator [Firmicutes bacterium]|nr:MarR family transcriptional regulator [Candidatus Fermentithermobacillaceae bacterium]